MCRNIKTLFNFDPPATNDEVRDAALQFVRKLSGTTRPSKQNQHAFDHAVEAIAASARELLDSLKPISIRAIVKKWRPNCGQRQPSGLPDVAKAALPPTRRVHELLPRQRP